VHVGHPVTSALPGSYGYVSSRSIGVAVPHVAVITGKFFPQVSSALAPMTR
jgi:hypothetical protein